MHGDMDQFWPHLDASMRICELLRPVAWDRPRSRSMNNICNFLHVISESTNWSLVPVPWEGSSTTNLPLFYEDGTLETTYGITAGLAELILRVTRLAQSMRYYSDYSISPPPGLQIAREHLAIAVESLPALQDTAEIPQDCDEHVRALLAEHIDAFALGIKVYFHVSVGPCNQERLDDLVQEVGCKLNKIEDHKKSTGKRYAKTATIMWPGFVAACEARQDHRDLWRRWWSDMASYGIGNIDALWNIVQESWLLRDAGSDISPAWLLVLRAKEKFILAV
jgi:arginine metabolism regulation protein II